MSYIIRRQVKKAIYIYEGRSYRNKKGRPRNKQRYLGRLDDDGVLITRKRKLPAQIKEYKRVTKHFILEPVSGTSGMSRRNPSQNQSLTSSGCQREPEVRVKSAQSPSQHQERRVRPSSGETGESRTIPSSKADLQISRRTSCYASRAMRQPALPRDSGRETLLQTSGSLPHVISRSQRTRRTLLRASEPRVPRVPFLRKGQETSLPRLYRLVC